MGGVLIPELRRTSGGARPRVPRGAGEQGVADPESFVIDARSACAGVPALGRVPPARSRARCSHAPAGARAAARRVQSASRAAPYLHARGSWRSSRADYGSAHLEQRVPGDHHARVLGRGILEHLGCAVWSANFGRRKPDPAMILHVLSVLRVPRARAIFVGDKLRTDVAAARRAGIRSVYIRSGATRCGSCGRPRSAICAARLAGFAAPDRLAGSTRSTAGSGQRA
jgi:hypothetical protein